MSNHARSERREEACASRAYLVGAGYGEGMALPILYSFRRCPYAMRARLALVAAGETVELREVLLRDKPAAMIALSPKATVPVLLLPDGGLLDESLDIMLWALRAGDAGGRSAGMAVAYDAALVAANDGPFKRHLDGYKYTADAGHRLAATDHLRRLDDRLDGRQALDGDVIALTDLAILPFVRQFADTDRSYFDALPLANLQQWLARFLGSDLFARIMIRPTRWQPDDPPVLFPQGAA